MSEYINNREHRQQVIKDIIRQLYEGKTADEVKQQFEDEFTGVSASEISEAEGALVAEGLPVAEIQRLCDVHAAVFNGSIEEIHQPADPALIPGHPANILKRENREIERIIENEIRPYLSKIDSRGSIAMLVSGISHLSDVNIHYRRKENVFFPYMEKHGITAPPKVMWGVDDEIRAQIKELLSGLGAALGADSGADINDLAQKLEPLLDKVTGMISKEENILIPMLLENLSQEEWKAMADESDEIGYLIEDVPEWTPAVTSAVSVQDAAAQPSQPDQSGIVTLPSGIFKIDELAAMLNTLPFDITFVDKDDHVKFFTEGKDRVFPRTRSIIGRNVSNCHPPASVHIVEKIVEDFKSGAKDQEDFWINMGGKYILIRYFAVRNESGEYMGVLEVTQDIKPIREITGEKRLMS